MLTSFLRATLEFEDNVTILREKVSNKWSTYQSHVNKHFKHSFLKNVAFQANFLREPFGDTLYQIKETHQEKDMK